MRNMTQKTARREDQVARRVLKGLAWGLLGTAVLGLLWVGISILLDADSIPNLVAGFYDLIGLSSQADAIRDRGLQENFSRLIIAAFAIIVGVGGVWILFTALNKFVDILPYRSRAHVRPWMFLAPALSVLAVYLIYPTIQTLRLSITEDGGFADNYSFVFTDPEMQIAIRNNALWLIIGTTGSVVIGLLFAVLADRVRREAFAKTFVFMPLAISMVGASVIWRFVYAWRPEGRPQIGLQNAIYTSLGNEPVPWLQLPPGNTFFLIVIMIWLQTGFAMVILSAALKGVPGEIIEAGRIDGASEPQLFFRVVLPSIRGAMITVATTVFIAILKVFDIVFVMTGGRFDTEVIANRMFNEMFKFRNFGRASALAVVLMIVVIPIMVVNIRNLKRQGVGQ
jgi:alpha-glucoside transport system permease protein